jgi:hypothetical protein
MVLLALILAACAGNGPSRLILSRLYFGTASPAGPVSTADFEAFLDTCVTPRFPQGLTRYAADGQWKGGDGKLVREKSVVVEIIRPDDAAGAARIAEIIVRYKARFSQEAVLLIEEKPSILFR